MRVIIGECAKHRAIMGLLNHPARKGAKNLSSYRSTRSCHRRPQNLYQFPSMFRHSHWSRTAPGAIWHVSTFIMLLLRVMCVGDGDRGTHQENGLALVRVHTQKNAPVRKKRTNFFPDAGRVIIPDVNRYLKFGVGCRPKIIVNWLHWMDPARWYTSQCVKLVSTWIHHGRQSGFPRFLFHQLYSRNLNLATPLLQYEAQMVVRRYGGVVNTWD